MAFGRKSKTEVQVPQEVQQYYDSERRERASVAWLLALGTLLVTLAVAFALFIGGRWVYRTLTHHDKSKKNPAITQEVGNDSSSTGTSSTSTTTPSSGNGSATPSAPASPSTPASGSGSSATSGNSSTSSGSATTPKTVPNTGPSEAPAALVNTGPGEIAGLFAATSAAGAVAHRVINRRRD